MAEGFICDRCEKGYQRRKAGLYLSAYPTRKDFCGDYCLASYLIEWAGSDLRKALKDSHNIILPKTFFRGIKKQKTRLTITGNKKERGK